MRAAVRSLICLLLMSSAALLLAEEQRSGLGPADAQGCANIAIVPFQTNIDFESSIQPILTESCVICHAADSEFLDLSAGRAAASLIDRRSVQDPNRWLVRPGQPETSLLVAKVLCSDPGLGGPMPPGLPLSPFQRALIHDWVLGGAPADHEDRISLANFRRRQTTAKP
ncbi:MAG: hypothetical protein EA418_01140 [Wenzhouxiangellaceae bacterium]|nr:MAG: hypothetical protein EA418_01140 [Wenzhouxiangellaceae bacterium]